MALGKKTAACLALVIFAAGAMPWTGWWVWKEAVRRTGIELRGTYVPGILPVEFRVSGVRGGWKDRAVLRDGDLRVSYDPVSLLWDRSLRLKVTSRRLILDVLNGWAGAENLKDVAVSNFSADLVIGRNGISKIDRLTVDSPVFQFRIENSEK